LTSMMERSISTNSSSAGNLRFRLPGCVTSQQWQHKQHNHNIRAAVSTARAVVETPVDDAEPSSSMWLAVQLLQTLLQAHLGNPGSQSAPTRQNCSATKRTCCSQHCHDSAHAVVIVVLARQLLTAQLVCGHNFACTFPRLQTHRRTCIICQQGALISSCRTSAIFWKRDVPAANDHCLACKQHA
jgi:hypothetical protein